MRSAAILVLGFAAFISFPSRLKAQPPGFQVKTLGLMDTEHTRDDGYRGLGRISKTTLPTLVGCLVTPNGSKGSNIAKGRTAWLFDGAD